MLRGFCGAGDHILGRASDMQNIKKWTITLWRDLRMFREGISTHAQAEDVVLGDWSSRVKSSWGQIV